MASSGAAYERQKERSRRYQAEGSARERDIGTIPKPKNARRRKKCERKLKLFCETYFPDACRNPWSKAHLESLKLFQMAVLEEELFAIGLPRGFGKSTLAIITLIWAIAYGHHRCLLMIGATNSLAVDLLKKLRRFLQTNELLLEDFPELCIPLRHIGNSNNRAANQLYGGEPTYAEATNKHLVLATLPGVKHAKCSGAAIFAGGLLSAIRGASHVTPQGEILRPTLGLVDDPQTRSSARSPAATLRRERVIQADLAGMSGQDESWSCLMTMTVIEPDDLADRMLDRKTYPDWRGVRYQLVERFPNTKAMELWEEYYEILCDCKRKGQKTTRAQRFFQERRKKMEAGFVASWDHAYNARKFLSVCEKAMEWYFRDREGFWSELQNNPAGHLVDDIPRLKRDDMLTRWHALPRFVLPAEASHVTAFADVHKKALYYEVRAWAQDSTSWVVDYGTWPGQSRGYFTLANLKHTLASAYPQLKTWDEQVKAGIRDLFIGSQKRPGLLNTAWKTELGEVLRITLAACDANYKADTVKAAIRSSGLSGIVHPAHGRQFTQGKALNDYELRAGERAGPFWKMPIARRGQLRHILFDNDYFKSEERDRLQLPPEAVGTVTLYSDRTHTMWAEHHCGEVPTWVPNKYTGEILEHWVELPTRPDNHLWDCSVGNRVLGSMLGVRLPGMQEPAAASQKRRPWQVTPIAG